MHVILLYFTILLIFLFFVRRYDKKKFESTKFELDLRLKDLHKYVDSNLDVASKNFDTITEKIKTLHLEQNKVTELESKLKLVDKKVTKLKRDLKTNELERR